MIDINNIPKAKLNTLRCVHRHTIDEHPRCFAAGKIRWANDRDYARYTKEPWYTYSGYKIGYLDIEADGLKADFSTLLSWAIKEKGGDVTTGVITKEELFNGTYDRRLLSDLLKELHKYSIVVTYYGTNYDIPYIRSKALHYNLEFPTYAELYHFDLYFLVKSKLNLSRKSLANVCDYLGIEGKTDIDKEVWRRAKYGDPQALKEVVRHNVPDVEILERLHDRIEGFAKWTRRSI